MSGFQKVKLHPEGEKQNHQSRTGKGLLEEWEESLVRLGAVKVALIYEVRRVHFLYNRVFLWIGMGDLDTQAENGQIIVNRRVYKKLVNDNQTSNFFDQTRDICKRFYKKYGYRPVWGKPAGLIERGYTLDWSECTDKPKGIIPKGLRQYVEGLEET